MDIPPGDYKDIPIKYQGIVGQIAASLNKMWHSVRYTDGGVYHITEGETFGFDAAGNLTGGTLIYNFDLTEEAKAEVEEENTGGRAIDKY